MCIVLRVHAEDGSLLTNLTLAGRAVEVAPVFLNRRLPGAEKSS